MRTAILEILVSRLPDDYFSPYAFPDNIRWNTADEINQLVCDCMATAMYRCTEGVLNRQGLARVRMAEYGFSKEEIEKSISKLENE